MRGYYVFNVEQTTLNIKDETATIKEFKPIEQAEKIINEFSDKPSINHFGNEAFYSPVDDKITLPLKEAFKSECEYYATLFHELSHSTGNEKRLNRAIKNNFGCSEYAKEEITAEISTAFLCAFSGIKNETIQNNTAYIQNWTKAIKDDKKFIFKAISQAQKSSDYILNKRV